jgi:hypothetical protein
LLDKYTGKSKFFLKNKDFWNFEFLGWAGPDSAQNKTGLRFAQNEIRPEPAQKRTYLWLDSTQPRGLG